MGNSVSIAANLFAGMRKSSLPLLWVLITIIYYGCGNTQPKERVAVGNVNYGGTFRFNETEPYATLYPHKITDIISTHIATQIYEGLLKFDPKTLAIRPSIAEKWEIDQSGKVYTFHLKKGVYFHDADCFEDGKGREVKAQDFKYSFTLLCTPDAKLNRAFSTTFKDKVVGANEYYNAGSSEERANLEVGGIKVLDDYTLEITLTQSSSSFIYTLARTSTAVLPKEGVEAYGENLKLGTGPFYFVKDYKADTSGKVISPLILARNEKYHGQDSLGNQLPYLDTLEVHFMNSRIDELAAFKNGQLEMVFGLPNEKIKEVVEDNIMDFMGDNPKYILFRSPEMKNQFYEFNISRSVFKDVKIRKAFCYAIDRSKLMENILKGQGTGPGTHGITPPSFQEYNIFDIIGYDFDLEKAKKLLAEAGYPDGKGFPKIKLELNSGGATNTKVALEIQKQLKNNININVDLDIVPFAQKGEDAKYARADLMRSAWVADYPSPENFLYLLYGKNVPKTLDEPSWPNSSRYVNHTFDSLYELGVSARTLDDSYKYFKEAEQIMLNDAPIMVLWYDENYQITSSKVKNIYINPMLYRDFSEVYFERSKAGAQADSLQAKSN